MKELIEQFKNKYHTEYNKGMITGCALGFLIGIMVMFIYLTTELVVIVYG